LLKILYLVHNLADAAVARRVSMMRSGGAEIVVAGFRRENMAIPELDGVPCIELGETFDARFGQRLLAVFRAFRSITDRIDRSDVPDVIVARNLEMLSLASRLQGSWPSHPPIVYECLDIHRLLLRDDVVGRSMRAVERHLVRKSSLLLTSSPAFIREYFEAYGLGAPETLLVENKVFYESGERGANPALSEPEASPGPLRIGWFGALRCRKSLQILAQFSNDMGGEVEVVLRGRPALTEFDDFHGFVDAQKYMRFEGPYSNPGDLARIYSDVHFTWAIDYFEEGQNSKWLLPNRIYEGCLHGSIPIALKGTETAALVARHNIGIILPDTEQNTLTRMVGSLGRAEIRALASAVAAKDIRHFSYGQADCHALVTRLEQLRDIAPSRLEAA
jgi:succinoglycan biosynthesis protein ExoL